MASRCRKPLCLIGFLLLGILIVILPMSKTEDSVPEELCSFGATNHQPNFARVAIIGAGGNVGSFLMQRLNSNALTAVTFRRDLEAEVVRDFGTVIFLAGCTGRRSCAILTPMERNQVMVDDIVDLVRKMSPEQHLVLASTAAVSEGRLRAKESDDVFASLLDEYSVAMMSRENALRNLAEELGDRLPYISMLRFGTVVGVSPGQRTDQLVPSLFKSAYTVGVMSVRGSNGMRSWLALPDLSRAIDTLIRFRRSVNRKFKIWNLASFDAKILKIATTVASITGAKLDVQDLGQYPVDSVNPSGFSLDSASFQEAFNFSFQEDLYETLLDFDSKVPDSIMAKGSHAPKVESIPCPVCGSHDSQLVLDLGSQVIFNLSSLKLVRCRVCNHYHLSPAVNFDGSGPGCVNGTCDWMAKKVQETEESGKKGTVLDLACDDGAQLDSFMALGWRTYGVDPAEDRAALAAKKHIVRVGLWPVAFPELPRGDALTAITAHNLAHVPRPVEFLKACVDVMGPNTKLYIQTSACSVKLGQLGPFHICPERMSSFTAHSLYKAAALAGLDIRTFETFQEFRVVMLQVYRNEGVHIVESLKNGLIEENSGWVNSDFFPEKYMAMAQRIRGYVVREIKSWSSKGYDVVFHGAQGTPFLDFLLADGALPKYVLEDAPSNQSTFWPGTSIPVLATGRILEVVKSPLTIVSLGCQIPQSLQHLPRRSDVVAILLFPEPKVVRLDSQQTLRVMGDGGTPISNPFRAPSRRKIAMITHFRNDSILLPFIIHHAPMFDEVIGIDGSNDRSKEIWKDFAPPRWQIVPSNEMPNLHQVMREEQRFPDHWVTALSIHDFLVYPQMRLDLFQKQGTSAGLMHPALLMVNDDLLLRSLKLPHSFSNAAPSCQLIRYRTGAESEISRTHEGSHDGFIARFSEETDLDLECKGDLLNFTVEDLCDDVDGDVRLAPLRLVYFAEIGGACLHASGGWYVP